MSLKEIIALLAVSLNSICGVSSEITKSVLEALLSPPSPTERAALGLVVPIPTLLDLKAIDW